MSQATPEETRAAVVDGVRSWLDKFPDAWECEFKHGYDRRQNMRTGLVENEPNDTHSIIIKINGGAQQGREGPPIYPNNRLTPAR